MSSGRNGRKVDKKIIFIQREGLHLDEVLPEGFQCVNLTSTNGAPGNVNACNIIEPGKLASFRWKFGFGQTTGGFEYTAIQNWSLSWALYIYRQGIVGPNIPPNNADTWPYLNWLYTDTGTSSGRLFPWDINPDNASNERIDIKDVIASGHVALGQAKNWNASMPASGLGWQQEVIQIEGATRTSRKVQAGDQLVLQWNGNNWMGTSSGDITCCGAIQYFFITQ